MYVSLDIHALSQISAVNCSKFAVEKCNRERALDCELFGLFSEQIKFTANAMQISTLKIGISREPYICAS